jgi:hypothetical protein
MDLQRGRCFYCESPITGATAHVDHFIAWSPVRNFASNTQVSYLHQVNLFARHFDKSPERLGPEEIRTCMLTCWNGAPKIGPYNNRQSPVPTGELFAGQRAFKRESLRAREQQPALGSRNAKKGRRSSCSPAAARMFAVKPTQTTK